MNEQGYTGQKDNSQIMKGEYQNYSLMDEKNQNENIQQSKSADQQQKDDDIKLLNQLYQNSDMGKKSISHIITKIDDEKFKKEVMNIYEKYDEICSKASMLLLNMGEKPKEKNPLSKMMLWGIINASTVVDDSVSNIANIIIKGCNNSKNNIKKTMNQIENVNKDVQNLADEYLQHEQDSIDKIQKFL